MLSLLLLLLLLLSRFSHVRLCVGEGDTSLRETAVT